MRARVWVVYPFAPGEAATQPETFARVAHVKPLPQNGYLVGLAFESPQGTVPRLRREDRRTRQRVSLALPLRARKVDVRWPEETMSADISELGVRFHSARFYSAGDPVRVAFTYLHRSWESAGEVSGRVVRVERVEDTFLDAVAVKLAAHEGR